MELDPLVFSYDEERGQSYESFVVSGGDTDAVVAALETAALRLMQVDEQGVERLESPADADWLPAGSYCSDPVVMDDGVEVYLDCQGSIEPGPEAALRRVLVEVLDEAGLHDVRVTARPFVDD